MGFETLSLADVVLDKPQPVPVGTYVFQIQPGAAYRINEKKNNIQELNIRFDVAEGDLKGRVVFFAYPDPSSTNKKGKLNTWSEQALKKLQTITGFDPLPGEDTAAFFNRIAGARITGEMTANSYEKDGKTIEGNPQFSPFKVEAAA